MASTSSQNEDLPDDLDEMLQDFAKCLENEEKTKVEIKISVSETKRMLGKYYYKVFKKVEAYPRDCYILREIADVLKFNRLEWPSNEKMHVIGVYKYEPGTHSLLSLNSFRANVKNPARIGLDFAGSEQFPEINSLVEIYGKLLLEEEIVIHVHFVHELGYDTEKVSEYVNLLKQRASL